MPYDGWLWQFRAAGYRRNTFFSAGTPETCVSAVLIDPPAPDGFQPFDAGQLYCKADGRPGNPSEERVSGVVTAAAAPEESLPAVGPIEDYVNQPYDRSAPAPTDPGYQTVKDRIRAQLEAGEYPEIAQKYEFELGSPAVCDPSEPFVCNPPERVSVENRERCDLGDGGTGQDPDPTRTIARTTRICTSCTSRSPGNGLVVRRATWSQLPSRRGGLTRDHLRRNGPAGVGAISLQSTAGGRRTSLPPRTH